MKHTAEKRRKISLKAFIVDAGLTMSDVAKLAGIERTHLSRIASGLRPSDTVERAVASALGISRDDLYEMIANAPRRSSV